MTGHYADAVEPHVKLAELMNQELGTDLPSMRVRRFIGKYWDRISWFAHSIHNELEREKIPPRTPQQALDAIQNIVDAAVLGTVVQRDEIRRIIESTRKPVQYDPYSH